MLNIDGSEKSGSGTVLRYGLLLSSLLNQGLHIYNIRAKREKPGLRPQHLKTVEAFKFLTQARTEGAVLNSKEILFQPQKGCIKNGRFEWDIGTAGSATMLGLAVLPLGFLAQGASAYRITGGIFQDFAPNAYHTKYVLMKILKKFSLSADLNVIKPGYVPYGAGVIEISVKQARGEITPLQLTEQGKIVKIEGISLSSNLEESRVSRRMAEECNRVLNKRGLNADIEIVNDKTARQKGAALSVWAVTDSGCVIGADIAGKKGRSSEQIGRAVAGNLLEDLDSGATVDRFAADQLIIYAGLSNGISRYRIGRVTDHIESNLWMIKDFLGAQVSIEEGLLTIKGSSKWRQI